MVNWRGIALWLAARLDEPSTYAGFGILIGLFGLPTDYLSHVAQIGMGIGGVLAVLLSEKKS